MTEPPEIVHRRVAPVMGTIASIHVCRINASASRTSLDRACDAVFAELERLEAIFSTYRADSAISRINRGELDIADAPREVADVLDACTWLERRSDGAFSAFRSASSAELDPAGLVKGWAAERAAAALDRHGFHDWILNVGGDILASGHPSHDDEWTTAIVDPHDDTATVLTISHPAGAVATSGTAQRGAHIHDGRGTPLAHDLVSVTVTGPSLTWADAFATTVFAIGRPGLDWIAQFGDYEAVAITDDRELLASDPRIVNAQLVAGR